MLPGSLLLHLPFFYLQAVINVYNITCSLTFLIIDLDFSFIEMNPFTLVNGEPYPLDMRGELDDTAAFKNFKKYVPTPFTIHNLNILPLFLIMNWLEKRVFLIMNWLEKRVGCMVWDSHFLLILSCGGWYQNVLVCACFVFFVFFFYL
jgi:succinyl-CoA synthetase beta subunit